MTSNIDNKKALVDLFKQDASRRARVLLIPLPFYVMFLAFGVNPQLVNTVSCSIALIGLISATYIAIMVYKKYVLPTADKWEKLAEFLNANPEKELSQPVVSTQFNKNANLGFNVALDKNQKFQFDKYLACERITRIGDEKVTLPANIFIAKFIEADRIKIETQLFNFDTTNEIPVYRIFAPLSVLNVINVDKPYF